MHFFHRSMSLLLFFLAAVATSSSDGGPPFPVPFSSPLPMLILVLQNGSDVRFDANATMWIHGDPPFHVSLHVRGRSSQAYPKKQFSARLDRPAEAILGMPAGDRDFALGAPYPDLSLLRDALGLFLARQQVRGGIVDRLGDTSYLTSLHNLLLASERLKHTCPAGTGMGATGRARRALHLSPGPCHPGHGQRVPWRLPVEGEGRLRAGSAARGARRRPNSGEPRPDRRLLERAAGPARGQTRCYPDGKPEVTACAASRPPWHQG